MAQIKISELPTLAQQLQSANYIPLIHNGITYKYAPFNYVVKNSGDETIAGVKNFTSTPTVNSSPVRTDAIDSTIRSSVSFILSSFADGARKRILNTHATNAITVTAYSGTTIEGQATMTLSAGHEVELELIGTDWRKTGWNEAALLTYSQPVDCTSRVAEYTGDGIPLIPDNVAGTTFVRDSNWTDLGGWTLDQATVSYVNGKLRFTATGAYPQIVQSNYSSYSGKVIRYKVKKISGSSTRFVIKSGSSEIKTSSITTGTTVFDTTVLPTLSSSLVLLFNNATVGDVYEIETLYIGTGAYDTPALDRAGNGNNLTLNAVTPVNGKYGKEMSFNGSTSFAQASSPVIGTTGTVAVRFKRNSTGSLQRLFTNSTGDDNGVYAQFDIYDSFAVYFSNGVTRVGYGVETIGDTTTWHTVIFDTSGRAYLDGNLVSTTLPTSWVAGLANLKIGQLGGSTYFNGIISHFRYDSRIWTADEARAWSLNPSVEDSLSMSEKPSSGDVMVWPENAIGTFTPTISFGGASTGITYHRQFGRYIKSSGIIHFWLRVDLTSKGTSSGVLTVSGIPKSAQSIPAVFNILSNGVSFGGYLCAYMNNGETGTILFESENADGTFSNVTDLNCTDTLTLFISGVIEA